MNKLKHLGFALMFLGGALVCLLANRAQNIELANVVPSPYTSTHSYPFLIFGIIFLAVGLFYLGMLIWDFNKGRGK